MRLGGGGSQPFERGGPDGGVVGPHYAASKAGITGLTHSYAALLAKEGITVNAVAPALIDTEMVRATRGQPHNSFRLADSVRSRKY